MKISFTSREAYEIKPEIINIKIRAYLKLRQYAITEICVNKIRFTDKKESKNRPEYCTRIGEGQIEIIPEKDKTLLKLNYKIKIDLEYSVVIILIAVALFWQQIIRYFYLYFFYYILFIKSFRLNITSWTK